MVSNRTRGASDGSDSDERERSVDPAQVHGIARDDGVVSLASAKGDVDVDDIRMPAGGTERPDGAGGSQGYRCDLNVRRIEKARQASLAGAAPGLSGRADRNADAAPSPPCLGEQRLQKQG